jgi:hypothetical protein
MSKVMIGPLGLPALYEDGGKRITTHSMLKQYLTCPKAAQYKYAERLKPRMSTKRDKPLKRGTWLHELLEVYYGDTDETWQDRHEVLTRRFNNLFDEEKEALGDLPTEAAQIMRSYLWHYGANKEDPHHGWIIKGTEVTLECPWPDSEDGLDVYRCRVDFLAENEYGLIIGDHKSHGQIPDHTTRTLDAASPLYIWCARDNGYDVRGFLWNYLRTKAPTKPKMVYVGTKREALSKAAIDTDYLTYASEIKALGYDYKNDPAVMQRLRHFKSQRWQPGVPQTSPFFRREMLEKDDEMIARVVASAMRTRDRMHDDYDDYDVTERSSGRQCSWCSFKDVCTAELFGGMADHIRRKQFRTGDPLDYYQDTKDTSESV